MRSDTVALLSNREVAPNVHELILPCKLPVKAGRFFMLKSMAAATLLARPISVCNADNGTVTFLVQKTGRGTAELCALREGDPVQMTGPLGNGFPVDGEKGNIALVGGGIGIAPMLLTAKRLKEAGNPSDCYLGYRSQPFYKEEIAAQAKGLFFSTDDGCAGFHGNVAGILEPARYDAVFCCGPMRMMQAVTELCEKSGTPVYVSMENKMGCGIGACLVCACAMKPGGNARACMDGPVFRGEDVCFDA
jgi:dihydroorotate dehydrogenase electron transfer subunit